LDVYQLISAYQNYGHFEADLILDQYACAFGPIEIIAIKLGEKDLQLVSKSAPSSENPTPLCKKSSITCALVTAETHGSMCRSASGSSQLVHS